MAGASVTLRTCTGLPKSEDNFLERYLDARVFPTPPVPLPTAGVGGEVKRCDRDRSIFPLQIS
ncbi:hypothetical protein [Microseira wollei]|uniref:hypothetical protein n=1 Tax=Microseira wollei TaxID=467598 RepID=UPI001CFDA068|nr:hypothetical protein [Microseira wollei]